MYGKGHVLILPSLEGESVRKNIDPLLSFEGDEASYIFHHIYEQEENHGCKKKEQRSLVSSRTEANKKVFTHCK